MKKNQTQKLTKTLRSIMKGRLRQKTSMKSRRLPGSPDEFLEVQTTLSEDFQEVQTTSRRLTGKSSKKSSRSEKPAYQIQI